MNSTSSLYNEDVLFIRVGKLQSLPPEIKQLVNLIELNLEGNNLTSLPTEIGQLRNLTELKLRGNPQVTFKDVCVAFASFPKKIKITSREYYFLFYDEDVLLIKVDEQESLPTEIGLLTNLSELDLTGNPKITFKDICVAFASFPKKIRISSREYDSNYNEDVLLIKVDEQESLPTEIGLLTNLSELDLIGNSKITFKDICVAFASFPQKIRISSRKYDSNYNEGMLLIKVDEQESLPTEIRQLTNLTELNLDGNNFSQAERTRIRKLLPNCKIYF